MPNTHQTRKILEIPVERIQIKAGVMNPMTVPVDAVRAVAPENLASASESVKRLSALALSYNDSRRYLINEPLELARDFCLGKTWQPWKEPRVDGDTVVRAQPNPDIAPLREERAKQTVSDLVLPYQGLLSHLSGLDRDEARYGAELIAFDVKSELDYARVAIRRVGGGDGAKWVADDFYDSVAIKKIIAMVPSLQPIRRATTATDKEWPYAPEIAALLELETATNEKRVAVTQDIAASIKRQVDEYSGLRLNAVSSIVGFRSDMWNAAQAVIRSARERVFMLSSFSNLEHIDDAIRRIFEASDGRRKVAIAFGEPDRGRDPDDIGNTKRYMARIQTLSPNFDCGISPHANLAKVVVSETGMVFLCSCNLFSGAMNSAVLESGLLIKDAMCAIKITQTMQEHGWVPKALADNVDKLLASLQQQPAEKRELRIDDKLGAINRALNGGKVDRAVDELKRLLRLIAERPAWSLLTNLEHRRFMRDCAGRFTNYLGLASDGLRHTGLDPTTIEIIAEQANKSGGNVLVWWGRHAPYSDPFDDNDARDRKEAGDILRELRQQAKKGMWRFAPFKSNQPMENHAKLFVVDGLRLMVSSDNTLAFSDSEPGYGDAGELGVVIDHPRLAMQTRGCMELHLPKARKRGDWNRWWAALAEEVYHRTRQPSEKIPLEPVLDALMDRIQLEPELERDWRTFEEDQRSAEIWRRLVQLGGDHGLFSISKSFKLGPGETKVALSPPPVWQRTTTNNRR
ncbi:MAG: hypothetical protein OXU22_07390 [Gammaproteobacteria bacterium]|nr:hypothetical protein [Gammaproteobacteria bacterium]